MHDEIEAAIHKYFSARQEFFQLAKKYPGEIAGNDNIIDCIGEYLALQFLRSKGRAPKKIKSESDTGFDLEDGELRISVKILTSDNKSGKSTPLKDPWDEFMLISLDLAHYSGQVGLITRKQFERAQEENPKWSRRPVASVEMLKKDRLIGRYGVVEPVTRFLDSK